MPVLRHGVKGATLATTPQQWTNLAGLLTLGAAIFARRSWHWLPVHNGNWRHSAVAA